MFKKLMVLLLLLNVLVAHSQNLPDLKSMILKSVQTYYPNTLSGKKFTMDGKYLVYYSSDDSTYNFVSIFRNSVQKKIHLRALQLIFKHAGLDTTNISPYGLNWKNREELNVWQNDTLFSLNLQSEKVKKIFSHSRDYQRRFMAPDNKMALLVRDNNIFLVHPDGSEQQITTDGSENIVYGDAVHRREFGIRTGEGVFWSPDGRYFAFYRKDQSMVTDYPYLRFEKRPLQAQLEKYPMAGDNNHLVKVEIYDIKAAKRWVLDTGEEPDVYLANITWDVNRPTLYLLRINRDQTQADAIAYSEGNNWKPNVMFTERDEKWLDPDHAFTSIKSRNDGFIYRSFRDGYYNLYFYSLKTGQLKQITRHRSDVTTIWGEDKKEKGLYYSVAEKNGLERQLYKLNLKKMTSSKITDTDGTWTMILNPRRSVHVLNFTSLEVPYRIHFLEKNKVRSAFYIAPDKTRQFSPVVKNLVALKADDGSILNGLLVVPAHINPSEKRPVLVYVYGGPGVQLIQNNWMVLRSWLYYMVQQGYVVWIMDNRGTANRGKEFAQATFRQLGSVELKDQLQGIDYLKTLPYVDSTRIGVHGWSYGGFMTLTLMTRAPKVFKAGVAGAPVVDWSYYETIYTERYMDTPQENKDGYEHASILNHIQDLKGRLLVIHGTDDRTVVWQHTILLSQKAIQTGAMMDYFIFPGHYHGVRGKDRYYLYRKMTQYFEDFLKN